MGLSTSALHPIVFELSIPTLHPHAPLPDVPSLSNFLSSPLIPPSHRLSSPRVRIFSLSLTSPDPVGPLNGFDQGSSVQINAHRSAVQPTPHAVARWRGDLRGVPTDARHAPRRRRKLLRGGDDSQIVSDPVRMWVFWYDRRSSYQIAHDEVGDAVTATQQIGITGSLSHGTVKCISV